MTTLPPREIFFRGGSDAENHSKSRAVLLDWPWKGCLEAREHLRVLSGEGLSEGHSTAVPRGSQGGAVPSACFPEPGRRIRPHTAADGVYVGCYLRGIDLHPGDRAPAFRTALALWSRPTVGPKTPSAAVIADHSRQPPVYGTFQAQSKNTYRSNPPFETMLGSVVTR